MGEILDGNVFQAYGVYVHGAGRSRAEVGCLATEMMQRILGGCGEEWRCMLGEAGARSGGAKEVCGEEALDDAWVWCDSV